MTEAEMAKLPGLFLRGNVYQLRVVVPIDLQETYGGRSKLIQSLGTSSRREAALRATQERAKILEEFAEKRRALQPQRLDTVTPEMAAELAQRVRAGVLRLDEASRDSPQVRDALREVHELATLSSHLDVLTIRKTRPAAPAVPRAVVDSLVGLSEGEAAALAGLNDLQNKEAGVRLAQRNLASMLPLVKEEAHKLGLTFDASAPGAREALQQALKAYRLAWQEVTQRDAGEIVDTPVIQAAKRVASKPTKLRDVFTRWKESKPRGADSHNAVLRSIAAYEEFTGDPPLSELTRAQGDGFRTWLQHPDRGTTSKTARDKLTWVKSLLNYASRDLELLPRNPWEGIDIVFKTTNRRRPWTDAELIKFFGQPLHTAYKLPSDTKAGADAAYWIPLLGLYTGARVGELAQLRVDDVEKSGGIHVLSLTDEGESQSIKTAAGVRKVPIHSELVRLGFLDYVSAIRHSGSALLWPALVFRKGKPGGYFSHWFGIYRRSEPIGFGLLPDFHCLRHTVRSLLAETEVKEHVTDTLLGHEVKGSTGTKVYTHSRLVKLRDAVESIRYDAVDIPRVYKPPVWHPPG